MSVNGMTVRPIQKTTEMTAVTITERVKWGKTGKTGKTQKVKRTMLDVFLLNAVDNNV